MGDAVKQLEIEIKLKLESFTDYLKLIGYLGQIESEDHHINAFFDTEDRQLARAGWALRVRAENKRGLVTIKSIPTTEGAAVVRQEIEAEIPRGVAYEVIGLRENLLDIQIMPIDYLKQQFPNMTLAKLIQFENVRQKKLFRIGGDNYLLEVDKTMYTDGSVDYELEVELHDMERIETVEDHLRKLFASLAIPFEHQTESKFARALKRAKIY
ncbi:MAG: CYTH domain-containing protein [bacterium]|nr:CYTH domain-containing protein [bacterium]